MSEPATKEDLEALRQEMRTLFAHVELTTAAGQEGSRQQQSVEHGSIFSKLTFLTEMMVWLKLKWTNFSGGNGNHRS